MEHLAIDGMDVAVEVVGTGRPIVLLHGVLQDSRAWRPQFTGLRDEFKVVAWDAPGCGRSADPPETWRFSDYADCLAGLISALGLVDPIIGGVSWGGTLAIEYLHRHPEGASALVLAGAYAGWAGSLAPQVRDERLASCLAQAGMKPEDLVPEWMPGLLTGVPAAGLVGEVTAMMTGFHPSGFLTMAHAMAEADLRPALPAIEVPVLLLYGDDDQRSPADTVGAALAQKIPNTRLVVIPSAGHLCHLEQPAVFNNEVRTFAAANL